MPDKSRHHHIVTLHICMKENYILTDVYFDENTTEFPSDENTLKMICIALLKGIKINEHQDDEIKNMLNELGISTTKEKDSNNDIS